MDQKDLRVSNVLGSGVNAVVSETKTNAKLDRDCCEFAGLGPEHKFAQFADCPEIGWCAVCYRAANADVHQYPPVSTDWGAAGRLMDALQAKGQLFELWPDHHKWHVHMRAHRQEIHSADSGPRALCLAVAALAEQSK